MSDINLTINEKVVTPIIQEQIRAAVVNQLGKTNELLETIVDAALNYKVNSDGKVSKYSSDNEHNWLEVICVKSIQSAAKEAIDEYLLNNKSKLKDSIKKVISKNSNKISIAFVDVMIEQAKSEYGGFDIELKINKKKRY